MTLDLPGGVVAGIPDGPLAAKIVPAKRRRSELAGKVAAFTTQLMALPPLSPDFSHKLDEIRSIGTPEIAQVSGRGAHVLDQFGERSGTVLQQSLRELDAIAHELDPGRKGGLLNPAKRLGLLRAKPDPEGYFRRYLAAQERINQTLLNLSRERDAMLRSNVLIDSERDRMLADMRALEESGVTARELSAQLEGRSAQLAASDPVRADRLRAEALYEAEQRAVEIARQMAIASQGWLALDLIERNNSDVISGATRAFDTMVLVLRGATTLAQMLTQHGLVLDRIAALNAASSKLIDDSGPETKAPIPRDAHELGNAFTDLYEALDTAESSRGRALADMREAANMISRETARASSY